MTKIFTMTHKKFQKPQDPVYVPLHVGRAAAQDLGYPGDDTGDSISILNCFYGELTGIYWVWKNYKEDGNVGICHYRRYFINEQNQIMTEEDYDRILSEYDIITSQAMGVVNGRSYWDEYKESHNERDLQLMADTIQRLYPEEYPVFCEIMNGKTHYFGNLMVAGREVFDAYCSWLFPIFFEMQEVMDFSSYEDEYHKRVFGFLSEQLLMVWVKARGLSVYECHVAITGEKAETVELKLALGQLIKMDQITQARQFFYEIMKVRPDLSLELSDLKQEIFIIEQILYICEEEQKAGQPGMLSCSRDLQQLIGHFSVLAEILHRYQSWSEEDTAYMQNTHVTDLAVAIIARNQKELAGQWERITEQYNTRVLAEKNR